MQNEEIERVNILKDYHILDSGPLSDYDSITRLASYICKVPYAGISFLDDKRQWFKSLSGLPFTELDKKDSFCQYTIQSDSICEIGDLREDIRFANHPLVVAPEFALRFYAAAPLISPEGFRIGTICVFDTKPQVLDDDQREALRLLAANVINLLQVQKSNRESKDLKYLQDELEYLFNHSGEIHGILNSAGEIEYVNNSVQEILGYSPKEIIGKSICYLAVDDESARISSLVESAKSNKQERFFVESKVRHKNGGVRWFSWWNLYRNGRWLINGRDITEQKKIHDEVEQLSQVASHVKNGVVINDRHGKIIWVNESFTRITAFTLVDVVGKRLLDMIKGEKTDIGLIEKARSETKKRKAFSIDLLAYSKTGEQVWLSIMSSVILDRNGEVEKEIGIITDITERKNAELELKTFFTAVKRSTSGVLIRNERSEVIWMNEALERMFGYKLFELKGRKLGDVVLGERTDLHTLNHIRQSASLGKSCKEEIIFYRKDGTPVWVLISNDILYIDGNYNRQIALIVDISEKKKDEEEKQLLSLVASKTGSGVLVSDSENRIIWVNEAWEKLLGYSYQEIKGKKPTDFIKGDDINFKEMRRIEALIQEEKPYESELLKYKKDGTPIWLSISSTPVKNSNIHDKIHRIQIINDITHRKLAEQELVKAREEALRLSKGKEAFLSVMSHEIRTPLNAVIGLSHILLEDNFLPSQLENLEMLKFSSENLLALINDVLDFSKIESGNLKLEVADVNLKDLIIRIVTSLQYKANEKKISLIAEIDPRIPDFVKGDSTRIYQIIINLIGNSIKFTSEGEVKMITSLTKLTSSSAYVRFEISDTGIGISKDKLQAIFEAYTQAEANISRKYGGTGLGLAITKQLINLYGSEIYVESEQGKGARFYFTIEFKISESVQERITEPDEKQLLTGRVLVVEDNKINQILARKVLERWGLTLDYAENGVVAVDKIMNNEYDLVLMDIHMPEMDGIEAARIIRGLDDANYQTLPIVALTASAGSNEPDEAIKSGMNDFVLKPYTPEVLYKKIAPFLNSAGKKKELNA